MKFNFSAESKKFKQYGQSEKDSIYQIMISFKILLCFLKIEVLINFLFYKIKYIVPKFVDPFEIGTLFLLNANPKHYT